MRKERDNFYDILKGVGIILMIYGHSIQYGWEYFSASGTSFFQDMLFQFIYTFHMPLFAIVSGMLFEKTVKKRNGKEFVYNRVQGLLIPILSWATIRIGIDSIANIISPSVNGFSLIQKITTHFIFDNWFIWTLLISSFLLYFALKLNNKNRMIYFIVLLFASLLTPDKLNFNLHKFIFPYFVFGYYLMKSNVINLMPRRNLVITVAVASLLFLILFKFYNESTFIYTTGFSIQNKNIITQLKIDFFRWIIGFVGCIMVMGIVYLLKGFYKAKVFKVISYLGMKSLSIYLVSDIIFGFTVNLVSKLFETRLSITLFVTIIVVLISLLIEKIISYSSNLSKITFGGR